MAVVPVIPTGEANVDTRDGNFFTIFKVYHDGTNDTAINVGDSAVSCALLGDNQLVGDTGVAVPAAQTTTDSTGISLQDKSSGTSGLPFNSGAWIANDGTKQVIIDSAVAAGNYYIVVRSVGSGAGVGHGANTLNY